MDGRKEQAGPDGRRFGTVRTAVMDDGCNNSKLSLNKMMMHD